MGDGGPCHPRDNIALRFLVNKLDLGYDLFDAIMTSREVQAKRLAEKLVSFKLPIVILGKSFKPKISYTDGSYALLVGYYVNELSNFELGFDENMNDVPCTHLLAHRGCHYDFNFNKDIDEKIIHNPKSFNWELGDFKPYLYLTEDYGKSWKLITNGINEEHFTRVLRSDKANKNILYTGTETGMYISYDKGNSWNKFQKNLPIVPITDLTIKDNSLIVATQGRSVWMLDDLTVIHQLSASINEEKLYKPKNSYRMSGAGGRKSLTAGTNLPNGVIVHYFLPAFDKDDEVKLSFHLEDGSLIKEFSNKSKDNLMKVKKGGNSFVWNMKYPGAKRLDKMVLWGADFSGAKAVPGDYIVKLKVNDAELTQGFTILKNPTSEGTIDNIKSQFEFVNEINGVVDKAHRAIEKIREIKSDLNKFQSDYADNESANNLIERSKTILESIDKIENELYQTKNQSNQDPLNYGVKLTNNLGNLNSAFRGGDFGPTDQDVLVKDELIDKVNVQLEKYNSIISEDIPNFNSSFKKLELDYLNVFM